MKVVGIWLAWFSATAAFWTIYFDETGGWYLVGAAVMGRGAQVILLRPRRWGLWLCNCLVGDCMMVFLAFFALLSPENPLGVPLMIGGAILLGIIESDHVEGDDRYLWVLVLIVAHVLATRFRTVAHRYNVYHGFDFPGRLPEGLIFAGVMAMVKSTGLTWIVGRTKKSQPAP